MKKISILRQYVAPQRLITKIFGWFSECRYFPIKNWMITRFIKKYRVDMSLAVDEDIGTYPTFNSFFTRHLKSNLRPIAQGPLQIACPADGCISQIGKISGNSLFQAKGFYFDLAALLGGDAQHAKLFSSGSFATIYLSPKDYHRVHMPVSGKLIDIISIPGKLFSVNQETARAVPNLFSRNARVVCLFTTEFGPMAVIFVGAMIVGSINLVAEKGAELARGDELGYFKLGSTVIVLFAEDKVNWNGALQEGSLVQWGQEIGTTTLRQ